MYFSFVGLSPFLQDAGFNDHDEWEILLNLEGEGTEWIGEHACPFTAGTVFCIPPKIRHGKKSKNGFRDVFIAYPLLPLPDDQPFYVFSDEEHRIEQLMIMIHDIYHKRENNYMDISDRLAQALEQIIINRVSMSNIDPRVASITNLTVRHFTEHDFSITDVIAKAGYCDDHIRRLFRREIGKTPLEYLTDLRINYAKKLLCEKKQLHYTVAEIATLVGFEDISYFSRVFKKSTGLSPRDYIRQNMR